MAAVRSPSSSDLRAALACTRAAGPEQLALHLAVRAQVFVTEQRIFSGSDLDEHDEDPETHHVIGWVGDVPAGTVRLYPVRGREPGLWKGDRLAVLAAHRKAGLGAPLVRHAVAAAGALGGTRMIALVQLPNVVFFRRLGWDCEGGPRGYVGIPHQRMSIALR